MHIIGITGGSGCGKSVVSRELCAFGGEALDADKIYHELLESSSEMRRKILRRFPSAVGKDGEVDRAKLASIVFSDKGALKDLNLLAHKYVTREIERLIEDCYSRNVQFVTLDAHALFESGADAFCDVTICVMADIETRIARITARDSISRERALARISAQPAPEFYLNKCDYTVVNDRGIEDVREQVLEIYKNIFGVIINEPIK